MRITKTDHESLDAALARVNSGQYGETIYGGNITFKKVKPLNQKGTSFNVRLGVADSHGVGGHVSPGGRATGSASWHAHGHFFDELIAKSPDAKITTARGVITAGGGNWQDTRVATPTAVAMGFAEHAYASEGSIKQSSWRKGPRGGTYRLTKSGSKVYKSK